MKQAVIIADVPVIECPASRPVKSNQRQLAWPLLITPIIHCYSNTDRDLTTLSNMFLPQNDITAAEMQVAEKARRDGYSRIEQWSNDAIPVNIRTGVVISVQEVECGDPNCAPIDTAVALLFPR